MCLICAGTKSHESPGGIFVAFFYILGVVITFRGPLHFARVALSPPHSHKSSLLPADAVSVRRLILSSAFVFGDFVFLFLSRAFLLER